MKSKTNKKNNLGLGIKKNKKNHHPLYKKIFLKLRKKKMFMEGCLLNNINNFYKKQ